MHIVMTNRYRITSSFFLVGLALMVVSAAFLGSPQVAVPEQSGEVSWDPCQMIVEYGPMHNLMSLVSFGALVVLTVQGLRNRPAHRWLAIAGVLGLILVLQDNEQLGCYTRPRRILASVWLGSIALLFLIHVFQPRTRDGAPSRNGWARLACQTVIALFLFLMGAWFTFYQVATILSDKDPNLVTGLVSSAQHKISWPAHLLFLLAVAASIYECITPTGSSTQKLNGSGP
jgi:hypothetical protein